MDWIICQIVRLFAWALRRLSLAQAAAAGCFLGRFAYVVLRWRRGIALCNLKTAFQGELSSKERKTMAKRVFSNLGCMAVEVLRMPRLRSDNFQNFAKIGGLENLRAALKKGKGVIALTPHVGNWELGALAQGYAGFPVHVVTRPLDNECLERRIRVWREASGNTVIEKEGAVAKILRALHAGKIVGILMDQNFRDRKQAVFVDFFGRPAATTPLVAKLHLRTGSPIVFMRCMPLGRGHFHVTYDPAFVFRPSGNREQDVFDLTQALTKKIEDDIRRAPQHWFWVHERWRTQPGRIPVPKTKNPHATELNTQRRRA